MSRAPRKSPRIGLALAGGGPLGAIYEIGALCALEEALDGISFTRLDHYVGVSAGAFIAASLANGMSPRALCASFIESPGGTGVRGDSDDTFDPAWLLVPAYGEFARRVMMLPRLAASALWRATVKGRSLVHVLERLGPALPTGLFSNELVHERLAQMFSRTGRSNDFRDLSTRLTLVATHLDTGEAVPFGSAGWDHVPISKAVQASSALPGLFPPVDIGGDHFVDGALQKTLHASVALDAGVDLLLCVNPLVPFSSTPAARSGGSRAIPNIVQGGLSAVLSQTFRSMIHSRMALGMKHYERAYPQTDIVLIEPDRHDAELYLANTFSYGQRRQLAEHAYRQTRAMLRERRKKLGATLARHGVHLRNNVLDDPARRLIAPSTPHVPHTPRNRIDRAIASLHAAVDELSRSLQQAEQSRARGHAPRAA